MDGPQAGAGGKYLGRQINARADVAREVRRPIAECMVVLKKLDIFWRHADVSLKRNIQAQEAVINTKLMYGLESLQLPKSAHRRMDTFHLKGLRKLLRMETTYVNRANTNEEVYRRTGTALGDAGRRRGGPGFLKLSDRHGQSKLGLYASLVSAGQGDPRAEVAFDTDTFEAAPLR